MDHTRAQPAVAAMPGGDEQRVQAILDGLRDIADTNDPKWQPRAADAQSIVDDAWSVLAEFLDDRPAAVAVLDLLRRLTLADAALTRAARSSQRLGDVISRLESATPTMATLVSLAPQLTSYLGFDRAIFSRVIDGLWVSRSVHIADDPQWADEINRVGQTKPQQLVPGLHETEIVRRREAMIVTDVQTDSRVHRPIADASRSRSYAAAPILSGNQVVGLLHADCYLQGRDPGPSDCDALATYARALQLAFSRAHLADGLRDVGALMRSAATQSQNKVDGVGEFSLDQPLSADPESAEFALAFGVTRRAVRSVRDVLTAREFQILELMAEGRSNAAIATHLVISEGTVKQHVKHILRKLRAGNRVEAVAMLYQSAGA
ncbi:LuxR C-terminal-related transcriptional regulator [Mycobacterium sp. shizuoka-1]|uniref:LuxR C-terminal-related transcriptional regulator n=1 Tax=Mycobacterium sp. shizuoka-1 TaxID=2039281 RepID=UPI000C05F3CE|nr:LuxR C-terminal-related transcriptional regulator [Mycobacterium sp. shizuoka-1]GAY15582.1 hypothetical protein MSZK_23080 [Mycobacterium sp. shizuoka-1]